MRVLSSALQWSEISNSSYNQNIDGLWMIISTDEFGRVADLSSQLLSS